MSEIIPAILPENEGGLRDKVLALPPEIKFIHLDVLEEDIWTNIDVKFEVHLMVREPNKIFNKWVKRGAKRIILHSLGSLASKCTEVEIGLGIELNIPVETILPLISQVDFVHLMSIAQIGAQGHPLDERIFDRIKEVKNRFPDMPISVDGGINVTNYQKLLDLGVDRLVVGSGFKNLWKSLTKN